MSDERIAAVWQAIGRYSWDICRPEAELAPPGYLLDAMKAVEDAIGPPGATVADQRDAARYRTLLASLLQLSVTDEHGRAMYGAHLSEWLDAQRAAREQS